MDEQLVRTLFEEQRRKLELPLVTRDLAFARLPTRIDVAVGMRRSGKTCFLLQTMRSLLDAGAPGESLFFVSFDDDRLGALDAVGAGLLLDGFYTLFPENHRRRCHLFLDEIHGVRGWAQLVRRYFDTKDVQLYLSGSSAKLLGREIATELRGRALTTEVWPYSLIEYLRAREATIDLSVLGRPTLDVLGKWLRQYLSSGGFPEVVAHPPALRVRLLQDYVDTVVFRDVVERHRITNISAARYLTRQLLRSIGRAFSVNKSYNDMRSQGRKIGKDTLYEYVAHFEDAYLCFAVPRYDRSPRRAENAPRKVYAVDPGLAAAFNFSTAADPGQLFENLLYLDLRRAGKEVFYYLTDERLEVDFVAVDRQGGVELLQSCFDPTDEATLRREQKALRQAEAELGVPGRLVTPESYLLGLRLGFCGGRRCSSAAGASG